MTSLNKKKEKKIKSSFNIIYDTKNKLFHIEIMGIKYTMSRSQLAYLGAIITVMLRDN